MSFSSSGAIATTCNCFHAFLCVLRLSDGEDRQPFRKKKSALFSDGEDSGGERSGHGGEGDADIENGVIAPPRSSMALSRENVTKVPFCQ